MLLYSGVAWVQFDSVRRPDVTDRAFSPEAHASLGAAFVRGWVLPWYSLLLGAAVLVPLRPRWWYVTYGAVVGLIVTVVFVAGYTVDDRLQRRALGQLLGQTLFWVLLGTALALFGRLRYEELRQQVERARRFGQYRLAEKLGEGGMGEVYRAEHLLLKRPSVIKMVRANRATDPSFLARFEQEVAALARLTHPNTVQVFDYGHTADGAFYYVMEYLPGFNLDELVRRHGVLPPGRAVYLLRQVCRALREAHTAGLIHRDVKPSNVMVCERGGVRDVAKLLDFGLVRGIGPEPALGAGRTTEGTVLGTPNYMSPEQAAGKLAEIGAGSDLYSLGATAYFLLAGRPPFQGNQNEVIGSHLFRQPPPLTSVAPDVPADLAATVMRCLAKTPADRFRDAGELEAALAACACSVEWNEDCAAAWWGSGDLVSTVRTPLPPTVAL